jgi:hypothetical protein
LRGDVEILSGKKSMSIESVLKKEPEKYFDFWQRTRLPDP